MTEIIVSRKYTRGQKLDELVKVSTREELNEVKQQFGHQNTVFDIANVLEEIASNKALKTLSAGVLTSVLAVSIVANASACVVEEEVHVKPNDNIQQIAADHGVTVEQIYTVNDKGSTTLTLPKVTTKYVNADALNVRSKPSSSAQVIGKLHQGDEVKVSFVSDGWSAILIKGRVCFVSSKFISAAKMVTQPSVPSTPVVGTKTMVVNATSLNVRSAASFNSNVIGSLKDGAKVEVTSISAGWAKIVYGGKTAYTSAAYLKTGSSNTTPVKAPSTTSTSYVVVSGDTMSKIAAKLGVSLTQLKAANPTINPDRLSVGQVLNTKVSNNPNQGQSVSKKEAGRISGVDDNGQFRYIRPDGSQGAGKATGNNFNELCNLLGKDVVLYFDGSNKLISIAK